MNSGKLLVACSRSMAALPAIAVHQVVPVGNEVPERAALVAERDAAVHAARALRAQLLAWDTAGTPRASRARARRRAAPAAWRARSRGSPSAYPRATPTISANSSGRPSAAACASAATHALVVARHHLDELRARPCASRRRMRAPSSLAVNATCRSMISCRNVSSAGVERLEIDHAAIGAPREPPVARRARRRCRRSSLRRSCGRSRRARRRGRRSCTRSRDRRRPRRPRARRCSARRSARRRRLGCRPRRWSRRRARRCR